MKNKPYLTAAEARRIADKYNENNEVNLNKVLAKMADAAKEGRYTVCVDDKLLDRFTKAKLRELGYRFGKHYPHQTDGVHVQVAMQEVLFGEPRDDDYEN